jgi:NADPH:quinone reductase-like Zn-dependent oxidoreductase
MNNAIALAALRPVYESFPWSQARDVLARMEAAGHFGKLVLTVE